MPFQSTKLAWLFVSNSFVIGVFSTHSYLLPNRSLVLNPNHSLEQFGFCVLMNKLRILSLKAWCTKPKE